MRVNTSSIGMASERTYLSRTVRATKMTITDVRQQLSSGTGWREPLRKCAPSRMPVPAR